jgi:hypothetical protein
MGAGDYEWLVKSFSSPDVFEEWLNGEQSRQWVLDRWQDTAVDDGWYILATFFRPMPDEEE